MIRIHPNADVSPEATIGAGPIIWRNVQIREQARLGQHCLHLAAHPTKKLCLPVCYAPAHTLDSRPYGTIAVVLARGRYNYPR